jgi:hypothetical protein
MKGRSICPVSVTVTVLGSPFPVVPDWDRENPSLQLIEPPIPFTGITPYMFSVEEAALEAFTFRL